MNKLLYYVPKQTLCLQRNVRNLAVSLYILYIIYILYWCFILLVFSGGGNGVSNADEQRYCSACQEWRGKFVCVCGGFFLWLSALSLQSDSIVFVGQLLNGVWH